MGKRRIIEDSDDEDDSVDELYVVKTANTSLESSVSEEDVVKSGDDTWFEKRDTSSMTANEKQKNAVIAKQQILQKKRGVATATCSLIKSRHTTRVYESPQSSPQVGVAEYDLNKALLDDTPDNNRVHGMSRLAKKQLHTKANERSERIMQREGSKFNPYTLEDGPDLKKKKKKKRLDNGSDEEGDNYHFYGVGHGDDDDGESEEEQKRKILEMKSREVIDRCTDLSRTLRKALQSWGNGADVGAGDGDPNEDTCVKLSKISCEKSAIRRASGEAGSEEGTHLLQQADIEIICPTLVLNDYQLVGVNWLKLLHQNDVNGVLADDMGLGKTVQTISFLAWLFTCREDPTRLREQVKRAHEQSDEEGEEGSESDEDRDDDALSVTSPPSIPRHVANANILPHLIVVPASTLANWCKEFDTFCPTLNVMRFHGSPMDKEDMKHQLRRAFLPKYQPPGGIPEEERIDVVITTYTMFERDSGAEDRSFLKKIPFEYLVLDEAHCIKNSQSSRYQNLRGLNPRRRLLLSGTPVQNDVRELLALLSFLMPKVFRMEYIDFLYDSFMDRFIHADAPKKSCVSREKMEEQADSSKPDSTSESAQPQAVQLDGHMSSLHELRCMLAPFVLRRLKCDVLRQMPPKIDIPIKLKMTERQASLYESIISTHLVLKCRGSTKGKGTEVASILSSSSNFSLSSSDASNIFSDLRKASNHPLLLRSHFSSEDVLNRMASVCVSVQHFGEQCDHQRAYQELMTFSDFDLNYLCLEYPSFLGAYQLPSTVLYDSPKLIRLKALLPPLIEEGHRILIFSQWTKMMDILGALLSDLQYSFLRLDGSTPVKERQRLIDEFERHVHIPIFVLSTRAGGLGINLTAADTVILHDLDFNPENDRQAEDRCHRIGQEKDVTIYKLITEGSVDESIFDMGERKKRLSKAVLADGASGDGTGGGGKAKDTSEINRMLKQALLQTMKKEVVDLSL